MSSTKTLNVDLPDALYSEISGEARRTRRTKGQVVRERLQSQTAPTSAAIADLFGIANLLLMAERMRGSLIWTTDRDFLIYRLGGKKAPAVLLPD